MLEKKTEQAVQLLKSGEFEKALKALTSLMEEYGSSADLLSYRGTVLLNLNRKREALNDFDRSVDLDPGYSYRYASRAFAKDALGDLAGAIADYERAIQLDPDDAIAHNNLGLLVEKSGNQTKAKQHFANADELSEAFFGKNAPSEAPKPESEVNLQPKKLKPDVKEVTREMYWQELTRILSSRKEFSRFFTFVLSGFKRNDD